MSKSCTNSDIRTLESIDEFLAKGKPKLTATCIGEKIDVPANYSLDGLNIKGNIPLEKIILAVRRFRNGTKRPDVDRPRLNILLSGGPGCGKTAFVRYLASSVGARLVTITASEILSKWIGETEQNIRKAFQEAREKNAILFLDEIDSFLHTRENADHSWEVSSVNELLQQMEGFQGVMIGATNFQNNLDKAVMRRFTFKLTLDYLTSDGKRIFFQRYFKSPLSVAEEERLDKIDNLAPGDFRTVKEELFYTCDNETNDERLAALEAESAARTEEKCHNYSGTGIGFAIKG